MRFVIIGGDAAGMSAASRAKRNNPQMEVTVLEKTGDVSYSACGMPYNIADPLRNIDDLVVRSAEVFRQQNKINLLTGYRVDKIDTVAKTVSGVIIPSSNESNSTTSVNTISKNNDSDKNFDNQTVTYQKFSYPYDKLLIATGATPIIPNLPGFDLQGVMPLKSLQDGRAIKLFLSSSSRKPVKKVVIVGMGYIGLEMCEALKARSIEVSMVKPGSHFLPWMAVELADVIKQELIDNGVEIYCGQSIHKIEQREDNDSSSNRLTVICNSMALDADMVIVASGVKPCSDIAIAAGLETSIAGAIAVNNFLKTSNNDIYAAGDCADAFHVVTGKKCWIPLALRANRAGWAVADNVCGIETLLPGVVGTAVFKVFGLQVARTGLTVNEAIDYGFEPVETVIKTRSRAHGHPGSELIYVSMVGDKISGRLLGVQMVGKEGVAHRINAAAVALHATMRVTDFAQTDLAYAPPFGPVWDPLLTAANQLLKKL